MDTAAILSSVKLDLQLIGNAYDDFILELIAQALEEIAAYGITLDLTSSRDAGLVRMYAAWLYRNRAATNPADSAMPRMLQFNLNNRLFSEKMSGGANR
jgi:hypothetical protein